MNQDIGIFGRYAVWNNQDGSGGVSENEYSQYNAGVNWWIDKDVVVKMDYQIQDNGSAITKLKGPIGVYKLIASPTDDLILLPSDKLEL